MAGLSACGATARFAKIVAFDAASCTAVFAHVMPTSETASVSNTLIIGYIKSYQLVSSLESI